MRWHLVSALSILVTLTASAHASGCDESLENQERYQLELELNGIRTSQVYQLVFDACRPGGKIDFTRPPENRRRALKAWIASESFQDTMALTSIKGISGFISRAGQSGALESLTKDRAFYVALHDCFGSDQAAAASFAADLIRSDVAGKAPAAAILLGIAWIGGVAGKLATSAVASVSPTAARALTGSMGAVTAYFAYDGVREHIEASRPSAEESRNAERTVQAGLGDMRSEVLAETADALNLVEGRIRELRAKASLNANERDLVNRLEVYRTELRKDMGSATGQDNASTFQACVSGDAPRLATRFSVSKVSLALDASVPRDSLNVIVAAPGR